jgi:predicted MFS family arabinose efflux permease
VGRARVSLRVEIGAGIRWLWDHRLLRTLAVTMAFGNLVFCAAFAIFVLYSRQRLGLSDVGYGVLLTTFAAGGLLGSVLTPRLVRRISATVLLRAGLLVEVALHATLAATTSPLIAGGIIVVFGIHTVVWGVVVTTVRQRTVPQAMFGRVTGVYSLLDLGGAALGSLVGGAVAQAYGIVATFWTAAAAMIVVAAVAWRPLRAASAHLRPVEVTAV